MVSGGVDSTVCAALLRHALTPEQIIALHIDNGFMRKNESENVERSLRQIGIELIVKASFYQFFKGSTTIKTSASPYNSETQMLCYTIDPEEKRKIIGDVFVLVTNQVITELNLSPDEVLLAQGTLRPDLIESASAIVSCTADTIKTHHNDTEMIRQLREGGRVIEPLKDFHKDEVRSLGYDLGLPVELIERHPFPGPGLAIRIICAEEPYIEKDFSETQVRNSIRLFLVLFVKNKYIHINFQIFSKNLLENCCLENENEWINHTFYLFRWILECFVLYLF